MYKAFLIHSSVENLLQLVHGRTVIAYANDLLPIVMKLKTR
jgi:hypothetical protein